MNVDVVPPVHKLAQCPIFIIRDCVRQSVQHVNQHQSHRFRIVTVAFLVHRHAFSLGVGQCCVYIFHNESFFKQPYRQRPAIAVSILQSINGCLFFCYKMTDLSRQLMKLCGFILNRDFSQFPVPAVQHDRCVGFLMQVDSHVDNVFLPQLPSFLYSLSPFSATKPPATSTDKRYVPIYALRLRPSQGGKSLSAPITKGFTGYSSFEVCRMLPLVTSEFKSSSYGFFDLCKML